MADEPELKQGDQGEWVRYLQQKLQALDFYTGAIDGWFGPVTEGAVKRLQQAGGQSEDGVMTAAAWHVLEATDTSPQTGEAEQVTGNTPAVPGEADIARGQELMQWLGQQANEIAAGYAKIDHGSLTEHGIIAGAGALAQAGELLLHSVGLGMLHVAVFTYEALHGIAEANQAADAARRRVPIYEVYVGTLVSSIAGGSAPAPDNAVLDAVKTIAEGQVGQIGKEDLEKAAAACVRYGTAQYPTTWEAWLQAVQDPVLLAKGARHFLETLASVAG
jgi:hypothetical protein